MTRINLVPVQCLTNKHLVAEYKELPRVFTHVRKHIEKKRSPEDIRIPRYFKLNRGHETFFFNKCMWVLRRYRWLYMEMKKRQFKADPILYYTITASVRENIQQDLYGQLWFNDWKPRPEDYYLSMARLCKKVKMSNITAELTGIKE